jgi:epoxyqueuosine reductase
MAMNHIRIEKPIFQCHAIPLSIEDFDPFHFDLYRSWVDAGLHAGMAYLSSERHLSARRNPALLFPAVRSIITFAFPYSPAIPSPAADDRPHGQVAAYALATDYHLTLPAQMDAVMRQVEDELDKPVNWQSYTDSAPILERGMAVQAGLGWIGKNGCLLIPGRGSYFLLGEVFCDAEASDLAQVLPPAGAEIPDRCGTCHRCVDACPTGCIRPDHTLDSARCLSYLTIEHKGTIPIELRPLIGDHVFGCDICQQVCPWNHAVPPVVYQPFDLIEELAISPEEFKNRYKDSPILRAKFKGYQRNLCITLGNSRDIRGVEILTEHALHNPDDVVRESAVWALEMMGVNLEQDPSE